MQLKVEIDPGSGFCYGVIRAVEKAELRLKREKQLFSLGAIVHNNSELDRLRKIGLEVIDLERMRNLKDTTVLIRAHGEPPEIYGIARQRNIELIDCTCPVVLKLQEKIRTTYRQHCTGEGKGQIVIFGKTGHAEVNGLIGQVNSDAVIIDTTVPEKGEKADFTGLDELDFTRSIYLFSQTTKDPDEYGRIGRIIRERIRLHGGNPENLVIHNTICRQVAQRHENLTEFAKKHSVLLFVSGKESSNGKVLYELCKSVNRRSYHIQTTAQIRPEWFHEEDLVGICGATSTPKWQLEGVAAYLETLSRQPINFQ